MSTHRIAVLGGDGIGPEVVDEGLKVLDVLEEREGFTTERVELRPRWPALPRHRRGALRRHARGAARVRRHLPRRGGHPRRPARGDREGAPAEAAVRVRPVREPATGEALPRGHLADRRAHPRPLRLRGRAREHRVGLRRRRRHPLPRHPGRGRHPGVAQHPLRRRARAAVRVRAGGRPRRPADAVPQDQRADQRRRPVVADLQRGRRGGLPRCRARLRPRRRGVPLLRHPARALRRRRDREPVRRHHHRPRRRRSRAGWGWPRAATSTRPVVTPRCSSRSTARHPTSRARARPTPRPRS